MLKLNKTWKKILATEVALIVLAALATCVFILINYEGTTCADPSITTYCPTAPCCITLMDQFELAGLLFLFGIIYYGWILLLPFVINGAIQRYKANRSN